ncbi:MAG: DUF29 domain-containing protein [Snowella sp.]|nr:DUF29 domain-containing protein [Snowella sp.]
MLTLPQTTYEQDFALWVEQTIGLLKAQNYDAVDWANLLEEIDGLTRSDRRELENRLITLFEHALKRRYVSLSDCYRGWEVILLRTQHDIAQILQDSPSLHNYCLEIIDKCYRKALKFLRKEYDATFPDAIPFPQEIEPLLDEEFWQ